MCALLSCWGAKPPASADGSAICSGAPSLHMNDQNRPAQIIMGARNTTTHNYLSPTNSSGHIIEATLRSHAQGMDRVSMCCVSFSRSDSLEAPKRKKESRLEESSRSICRNSGTAGSHHERHQLGEGLQNQARHALNVSRRIWGALRLSQPPQPRECRAWRAGRGCLTSGRWTSKRPRYVHGAGGHRSRRSSGHQLTPMHAQSPAGIPSSCLMTLD